MTPRLLAGERIASRYQAVLLAAGRGSRLGPEGADMPKSLLPIGPRSLTDKTETSLLRRQVELLAACGVEQIVVVVGYQRQLMIDALDEWAPDVTCASSRLSNCSTARNSSRSRPLNDSTNGFSHGAPGSM